MSELHSVVVPMYCEAEVADDFLGRLTAALLPLQAWEIVVVDDGSWDDTFKILTEWSTRDSRVKVIRFARNFGHQAAISAGLHHAKGVTVTVIDADLQDPPELIPQMVEEWRRGAQIVYAIRTSRAGESAFKRASASLFYRILQKISSTSAPLDCGDFRLMGRRAVDAFCQMGERNRYVRGMVGWIGMPESRVYYARDSRKAGETKYPVRKMVALAVDGVVSFSTVPLRMAMWMGSLSALFGFAVAIWATLQRVRGTVVQGWTSTMVALLFIGGIQLLSLGVVGEYIGRIYDEVRRRPLYLIGETIGINEGPVAEDSRLPNADVG